MSAADEELPGVAPAAAAGHPTGSVERAVRKAIAAASLDDRDAGAAELAAACGRAVDLAHGRRDPYAVASTARELRETLTRLRLDPESRQGADAGELGAWLAGLEAPEPAAPGDQAGGSG